MENDQKFKAVPNRKYYAHSGENPDFSDWQPLSDHLESVGSLAAVYASLFGAEVLAKNTGLLHDLGKYCQEFFNRLQGSTQSVDHSTAGAKVAFEKWGKAGQLLSFCIAGHHAGLANGIDEGIDRSTLKTRLGFSYAQKNLPVLDEVWKTEIQLDEKLAFPNLKPALEKMHRGFQCAFLTRMIFSCLIDADRTDTSNYYKRLEGKEVTPNVYPTLQQLQDKLNETLSQLAKKSTTTESLVINVLRQHILEHSVEQAKQTPGLFSMTVPTGGGKTYTSMAFALEHARFHQASHAFRRVIYVIPFTSIIEQNARVFKEAFGEYANGVLEHHSAFDVSKLPTQTAKDVLKEASERWDAPVVVTTAVQFFESLFSDRTSQCRKLHNIAGSVIILDEAQTLPLKLLRPIMCAIDELARNYKCTVVLCTATQPALKAEQGFHNGFKDVREIAPTHAPSGKTLFDELRRTKVTYLGMQTDDQLVDALINREQVLMIVNNRRHARSLFEHIQHLEGATHLTTLMCAEHRSQVLEKVKAHVKAGKPCRLISTSLIEAGVDVDFPCVFRAAAGLDSIAQAAGRCNREGKRPFETSEVFIFESPDWKTPPELNALADGMKEVIRNFEGDVLTPEAMSLYFELVYWKKGAELDSKNIIQALHGHADTFNFPFQNVARDFSMIDTHMKPLIIPFDDKAKDLIEQLWHAEHVGGIARQLQRYLVQIPEHGFKALVNAGVVEAVAPRELGDQFWVLTNICLYDKSAAGLSWENPHFLDAESTVM